jgi:hypothetical protein
MATTEQAKSNGPAPGKVIDEEGKEVLDPRRAVADQTLAVDLARVELDQQIATAHRFPRSIDVVVKKVRTLATYNREAAENCIYALPRAGKPIIGPSIGFASIVAQSWGNCRVAAAITYVDRREKSVIAHGRFFDLETNAEVITPVTRRIVDGRGRLYSDDMINVTGMAAASIAARNAILRGVTRGIWHPIYLEALEVVRGDVKTFAERKADAVKAMGQFGVSLEQLLKYLGLKGEVELTLEHIPTLRGCYAALRDGSISVEELLDPRRLPGSGFEQVDNPLGDEDSGPAAPAAAAVPAAEVDPTAGMGEPAAQAAAGGVGVAAPAPAEKNAPAGFVAAPAAKPTNAEEFLDYWEAFLLGAPTVTTIKNRWGSDRSLRGACKLSELELAQCASMRAAREAELAAK